MQPPGQAMDQSLDFISHSVTQTQRIGARLGELALPGDVFLLEGELGSGKTCLTQGIARGLGINGFVSSPTFTLINEYRPVDWGCRLSLYHIDFYRLDQPVAEALDLGLDDYLYGDGLCVVEWAERVASILPAERLYIQLKFISETKRGLCLTPTGPRYEALLREFKRRAFGI